MISPNVDKSSEDECKSLLHNMSVIWAMKLKAGSQLQKCLKTILGPS